jgi:hypothetical protein
MRTNNPTGLKLATEAAQFVRLRADDLVGEHSVVCEGRPRGLLDITEETLPA